MNDVFSMEHDIVSVIVLCLLLIVLVMQIQMSKLSKNIQKGEEELSKKVGEVLKKIIKNNT